MALAEGNTSAYLSALIVAWSLSLIGVALLFFDILPEVKEKGKR
ncbi:hypothetical protein ACFLWI_03155 [Chloroflexota bacterium]